jgi:hypothetical protein
MIFDIELDRNGFATTPLNQLNGGLAFAQRPASDGDSCAFMRHRQRNSLADALTGTGN